MWEKTINFYTLLSPLVPTKVEGAYSPSDRQTDKQTERQTVASRPEEKERVRGRFSFTKNH